MLKIARSRRCGSNASKLGMIGRVVSVIAAAVADVRPGEHALRQQAAKLVRANSSIARWADDEASRRWRQRPVPFAQPRGCSLSSISSMLAELAGL